MPIKKIFLFLFSFLPCICFAGWFSRGPDIKKFFKDPIQVELVQGVVDGNLKKVEATLQKASPSEILNRPGYLFATPMHFALTWGTPEIITFLIQKGGDPFQLAYGYGWPIGSMLTSVDNLKLKLEKIKAIQNAGVKLSSPAFAEVFNAIWGTLHPADFPQLRDKIIEQIFAEDPKAFNTIYEQGNGIFFEAIRDSYTAESIPFLLKLLDAGFDPLKGQDLNMPLAILLLRASQDIPEPERKKVLEALNQKGVSEEVINQKLKPHLVWKSYFPKRTLFEPEVIYLNRKTIKYDKNSPRLSFEVLIVDKNLKERDQIAKNNLVEVLKNLSAKVFTWHKNMRILKTDAKYIESIQKSIHSKEDLQVVEVDLAQLFPEWSDIEDKFTIIELRTNFLNKINPLNTYTYYEKIYLSKNGTLNPILSKE